jgi:hypothetical protein
VGWQDRVRDGYLVRYPYFDIEGHQVWGATAMILSEVVEIVTLGPSTEEALFRAF